MIKAWLRFEGQMRRTGPKTNIWVEIVLLAASITLVFLSVYSIISLQQALSIHHCKTWDFLSTFPIYWRFYRLPCHQLCSSFLEVKLRVFISPSTVSSICYLPQARRCPSFLEVKLQVFISPSTASSVSYLPPALSFLP